MRTNATPLAQRSFTKTSTLTRIRQNKSSSFSRCIFSTETCNYQSFKAVNDVFFNKPHIHKNNHKPTWGHCNRLSVYTFFCGHIIWMAIMGKMIICGNGKAQDARPRQLKRSTPEAINQFEKMYRHIRGTWSATDYATVISNRIQLHVQLPMMCRKTSD